MSLEKPTPSMQTRRAVTAGVDEFMKSNDPLRDLLRNASDGLQVFSLGLKSIATGGTGIDTAKPVGWRFMAQLGGDAAAAQVHTLKDAPKMSSLSRGPEANALKVVSQLAGLPQTQDQAYEVRVESPWRRY
jgi:hypothetical protein